MISMVMILTVAYLDYILLRTYCGEYLRFTPKYSTHKEKVPKTKKGKYEHHSSNFGRSCIHSAITEHCTQIYIQSTNITPRILGGVVFTQPLPSIAPRYTSKVRTSLLEFWEELYSLSHYRALHPDIHPKYEHHSSNFGRSCIHSAITEHCIQIYIQSTNITPRILGGVVFTQPLPSTAPRYTSKVRTALLEFWEELYSLSHYRALHPDIHPKYEHHSSNFGRSTLDMLKVAICRNKN